MSTILTLLSSTTFQYTGSGDSGSGSVRIQCWGAGGHGSHSGVGGSGGAYAEDTIILQAGNYFVNVGIPDIYFESTNIQDTFISSSDGTILVRAPGGNNDGTIDDQYSLLTGSIQFFGGRSPVSNNSGGGSSAGPTANGVDGQDGRYSTDISGAQGAPAVPGGGCGGESAYYNSGAGRNQVYYAQGGGFPGGGGGGDYSGYDRTDGTTLTGAQGGSGQVILTF